MQTVILCGGMGTRAYPHTREIPKALLEVDGIPILEHVMGIYALYGHTEFILSLGYLKEAIIDYFGASRFKKWDISFVDTGVSTDTGGRIERCKSLLDETFFVTYCDGLGDLDLNALLNHHQQCAQHGGWATITSAPLRSQYGILKLNSDQVTGFEEKPLIPNHWINAGFFVFQHEVFDDWQGENLERDVLPHLAQKGMLYAYQHTGFWKSMDTYKDLQAMNALWPPVMLEYASRVGQSAVRASNAEPLPEARDSVAWGKE